MHCEYLVAEALEVGGGGGVGGGVVTTMATEEEGGGELWWISVQRFPPIHSTSP